MRKDQERIDHWLKPASAQSRFELIERLGASLAGQNVNENQADMRLADYVEAIQDLPQSLVETARKNLMKSRVFMPKPAEIMESVAPEINALLDAKHQITRLIDRAVSAQADAGQ